MQGVLFTFIIFTIFFDVFFCQVEEGHAHEGEEGHAHEGEEGHAHEGEEATEWEWAGAFDVATTEEYTWVANKNNGSYPSEGMKILIVPTSIASVDGILATTDRAEALWNSGNTTHVGTTDGVTLVPEKPYIIEFNFNAFVSTFQLAFNTSWSTWRVAATSPFVIYTQHDPSEYGTLVPYLVSSSGVAVTAAAVYPPPAPAERQNPVGVAIGASFCVAIASFVGVIVLMPGFAWAAGEFNIISAIDAFASGAILAVIVYIIIPEAIATIQSEYPNEAQSAAWFGSLLLAGFVTPILIDWAVALIFPEQHGHGGKAPKKASVTEGSHEYSVTYPDGPMVLQEADYLGPYVSPVTSPMDIVMPGEYAPYVTGPMVDAEAPEPKQRMPLATSCKEQVRTLFKCCPMSAVAWSITIGDSLHNFTDGVLIGVAFRLCSGNVGWAVAGASVVHELAAELSEFWLLISPDAGGLTYLQAVLLNFLTSLTVVLGTLIVSYVNITDFTIGLLLSYGGGVLLYVGAVAVWARLLEQKVTLSFVFLIAFSFAFGAVAIGLVLLSHTHCSAGESADAHSGHGH